MEELLYYVNLYFVPVIVVAVLFTCVNSPLRTFAGKRYFRGVLVCVELGIVLLLISFAPGDSLLGHVCIWAGSLGSLLFTVVACYAWLVYVFSLVKQTEDLRPYRRALLAAGVPVLLYCGLLLSSIWHDLFFSVSPTGAYTRGALAWLPYGIAAAYLLYSSALAWMAGRREILPDRRREYLNLTFFLVLPVAGMLSQLAYHEYPAVIPCAVLALLIIYLNMIRGHSTLDPLTGMNNRRQFNRYLAARFSAPERGGWCLIMIDLDGFKQINDVLGHTAGDRALTHMAQALRRAFQEHGGFVARYGGDEFVAVASCRDQAALSALLDKLAGEVEALNRREDMPFTLQYSLGCAMYSKDMASPEALLHLADEQMYRNKKLHQEGVISPVKEVRT